VQPLVITFDDEHYPILPSWGDDEGKPLSELWALLRSYFNELWSKYFTTYNISTSNHLEQNMHLTVTTYQHLGVLLSDVQKYISTQGSYLLASNS